ncbi:MAG: hypothetical protein FD147_1945 [Chloroflexi bacterium]|nr:MAG: hypothetical protein FD147_1945 [Chloroflexota bacterium]
MTQIMKRTVWSKEFISRLAVLMTLVFVMLLSALSNGNAAGIPLIYISAVNKDVNVTISGVNFPAGQTFTVRMGAYGTLGIGGVVVGTKDSAAGSSFTATYNIPASLVGASKIAIRFDSPEGYYSYNWFVNQPTSSSTTVTPAATASPGYSGIPTFSITSVQQGVSVKILTNNFPAGQIFTVRMGEFGTLGIGGVVVGTTDSGSGGTFSKTYTIPAALAGRSKIAIRLESPLGFYSYNWFNNNASFGTGGPIATTTPGPTPTPGPTAVPGYVGIPTFSIVSVAKNTSVTIAAVNFPPGQTFTVRIGEFGTRGIGGTVVTTVASGAGGSFNATYSIPAVLAGRSKIAIRLESATGYYYAYNWFYNN